MDDITRLVELITQEILAAQGGARPAAPAANALPQIAAEATLATEATVPAEGGEALSAQPCATAPLPCKQPRQDAAELMARMQKRTTARIGIGRAGARMTTATVLKLRADHAAAKDSVNREVSDALLERMGLFSITTLCTGRDEYLTRPDLGRQLDEAARAELSKRCTAGADVQIYAAGGLSSTAVEANIENILPALTEGLQAKGISVGTPFYARFARVPLMDVVAELLHPKVTCVLIGERPGLVTAESMSAYIAYEARVGMPESRRTVVSNIHKGGISAAEAGAYLADVIQNILAARASGTELMR